MEINIAFRNVTDVADVPSALLALAGAAPARSTAEPRRPTRRQSSRPSTLLLTSQEIDALQQVRDGQDRDLTSAASACSTDNPTDTPTRHLRGVWRPQSAEAARPKIKPQPFSAFQRPPRQRQGSTVSPRPYRRRVDQVGAADVLTKATPTSMAAAPRPAPSVAGNQPASSSMRSTSARRSRSRTPARSPARPRRTAPPTTTRRSTPPATRRTSSPAARRTSPTSTRRTSSPVAISRRATASSRQPRPTTPDSRGTSPQQRPRVLLIPKRRRDDSRLEPELPELPDLRDLRDPRRQDDRRDVARRGSQRSSRRQPAPPRDLSYYLIDWAAIEIPNFPIRNSMKQYITALAAHSDFKITGGVLLERDVTWDRGGEPNNETMHRYYYLSSTDIMTRSAPLPTEENRLMFWTHACDVGSLAAMLKERDMKPMNAHGVAAFGCNIFYAMGHEIFGTDIDEYSVARCLYNAWRSSKNKAGLLVGGKAWGTLQRVTGGSWVTAKQATEQDDVLKDANSKAFCISRNKYHFGCLAFDSMATPPSTAAPLIQEFCRKSGLSSPQRLALL